MELHEAPDWEQKVWSIIDRYYTFAESGFRAIPGASVILALFVVFGLLALLLVAIPFALVGLIVGDKNDKSGKSA